MNGVLQARFLVFFTGCSTNKPWTFQEVSKALRIVLFDGLLQPYALTTRFIPVDVN